jgi:hypothetical protein
MPAPGVGRPAPRQRLDSAGYRRQAAGSHRSARTGRVAGDGQPAWLELPGGRLAAVRDNVLVTREFREAGSFDGQYRCAYHDNSMVSRTVISSDGTTLEMASELLIGRSTSGLSGTLADISAVLPPLHRELGVSLFDRGSGQIPRYLLILKTANGSLMIRQFYDHPMARDRLDSTSISFEGQNSVFCSPSSN